MLRSTVAEVTDCRPLRGKTTRSRLAAANSEYRRPGCRPGSEQYAQHNQKSMIFKSPSIRRRDLRRNVAFRQPSWPSQAFVESVAGCTPELRRPLLGRLTNTMIPQKGHASCRARMVG